MLVSLRSHAVSFALVVGACCVARAQQPVPAPAPAPAGAAGDVVKVRVLDRQNGPVQACRVRVCRWFAEKGGIGAVPDLPQRELKPADFAGDFAAIAGLSPGEYVLLVDAELHARTRSAPFTIAAGERAPEVTVKLTIGGALEGRVVDAAEKPVAGAVVATGPNRDALPAGFAGLDALLVTEVTETTAKTDAEGRYRIPLLSAGDYRLKVTHADYCTATAKDVAVRDGEPAVVPALALERGALVKGDVKSAGKPIAGATVVLSKPTAPGAPPMATFTLQTVTAEDGTFVLPQRVPAGEWTIKAYRTAAAGDNPFGRLLEMHDSQKTVEIGPGDAECIAALVLSAK